MEIDMFSDMFRIIIGGSIAVGGLIYIFQGNWGLVISSTGLTIELVRSTLK